MSADLQASVNLQKLRLPATVEIEAPQSSDGAIDDQCRTPTSEEHKIPAVLSCPPAPRKARRVVSCKRKLIEVEFFEIVNREEIEEFFRASFESAPTKRRCACI